MISLLLTFQSVKYSFPDSPENTFFDIRNPIFLVLFISAIVIVLTYLFTAKIFIPFHLKHKDEIDRKDKERQKLMALFSELNPEPLLRFNSKGQIIDFNDSAAAIFKTPHLEQQKITEILPAIEQDELSRIISQSGSIDKEIQFGSKYYKITFIGFQTFDFGQAYFNDITEPKELNIKLSSLNTRLIDLTQQLNMLSEKEREKIAKDLHDGIGQYLSVIKQKLNNSNDTDSGSMNQELLSYVDIVIRDIKEIALGLKPRLLNQLGLDKAIHQMVEDINKHFEVKGTYASYDLQERFEYNFELTLYRIIQELINNIVKHSKATEFTVEVFQKSDGLSISVQDNGNGFDTSIISQGKTGVGLLNLSERIKYYQGVMEINASKKLGTEVLIDFPLEAYKNGTN